MDNFIFLPDRSKVSAGNSATGKLSVALGQHCTASGDYSLADGSGCIASTTCSVALGNAADASGTCGFMYKDIGDNTFCFDSGGQDGSGNIKINGIVPARIGFSQHGYKVIDYHSHWNNKQCSVLDVTGLYASDLTATSRCVVTIIGAGGAGGSGAGTNAEGDPGTVPGYGGGGGASAVFQIFGNGTTMLPGQQSGPPPWPSGSCTWTWCPPTWDGHGNNGPGNPCTGWDNRGLLMLAAGQTPLEAREWSHATLPPHASASWWGAISGEHFAVDANGAPIPGSAVAGGYSSLDAPYSPGFMGASGGGMIAQHEPGDTSNGAQYRAASTSGYWSLVSTIGGGTGGDECPAVPPYAQPPGCSVGVAWKGGTAPSIGTGDAEQQPQQVHEPSAGAHILFSGGGQDSAGTGIPPVPPIGGGGGGGQPGREGGAGGNAAMFLEWWL